MCSAGLERSEGGGGGRTPAVFALLCGLLYRALQDQENWPVRLFKSYLNGVAAQIAWADPEKTSLFVKNLQTGLLSQKEVQRQLERDPSSRDLMQVLTVHSPPGYARGLMWDILSCGTRGSFRWHSLALYSLSLSLSVSALDLGGLSAGGPTEESHS